ncbi:MAG: Tetratricopeptide 2 repeat protein [Bryobacterales bacterium]|nr:Tetratricopeptide 2 repeat protein [Bryobacterales bacterium]
MARNVTARSPRSSIEIVRNGRVIRTKSSTQGQVVRSEPALIWYCLAFLGFGFLAFQVYSSSLHGPFVFDDLFLPYTKPNAAILPLKAWLGVRPLLGLSLWIDFHLWGLNTLPYHVVNVLLHWSSAVLLFWIVRKLLSLAGTKGIHSYLLSFFAALLFLLHPVQTEAVSYIASRSENQSAFFLFSAFCIFLYRKSQAITWPVSLAVLALFLCALATKEHVVAFPALLLLTDYYWNPGFRFSGIRANARIYIPLALASVAGAGFVWRYVSADPAIGFHVPGLPWYSYFFTECRAFFKYLLLFVFPVDQNVDHDFPISHTLLEHGAAFALLVILFLISAAVVWRRKFPLASYGLLVFVIFLAPTSSFIPIHDVFVERRLYLPFIGLLLIAMEPLRKLSWRPATLGVFLACIAAIAGYLTWSRAHVWSNTMLLWQDSALKSPNKARVRQGLGNAYLHAGRCDQAVQEYDATARLQHPDFTLYYNWAMAYDCAHRPDRAAEMLGKATADRPTASAYAMLGYVHAEQGSWTASLDALLRAEQLDPGYALTYAYRGMVLVNLGQRDLALGQFAKCLELDPLNTIARNGWAAIKRDAARH